MTIEQLSKANTLNNHIKDCKLGIKAIECGGSAGLFSRESQRAFCVLPDSLKNSVIKNVVKPYQMALDDITKEFEDL